MHKFKMSKTQSPTPSSNPTKIQTPTFYQKPKVQTYCQKCQEIYPSCQKKIWQRYGKYKIYPTCQRKIKKYAYISFHHFPTRVAPSESTAKNI